MTLIEHIRELRSRLFKATLAIVIGMALTFYFAADVQDFVLEPYCSFLHEKTGATTCAMNAASVLDPFMVQLKIALYLGMALTAPFWLYQLWAFVAPGLLKRERRYAYSFAAVATPLFIAGLLLGFFLVSKSIHFFLGVTENLSLTLNIDSYFDFVTSVMLLFGVGFEFPLLIVMLNLAGVVSAKRLLSWWRIAVFLMFLFAALVTPTPDPFNMTILALSISVLYFAAVGFAFIVDARRAKRQAGGRIGDDEVAPIEPVSPVDAPTWGVHGTDDSASSR